MRGEGSGGAESNRDGDRRSDKETERKYRITVCNILCEKSALFQVQWLLRHTPNRKLLQRGIRVEIVQAANTKNRQVQCHCWRKNLQPIFLSRIIMPPQTTYKQQTKKEEKIITQYSYTPGTPPFIDSSLGWIIMLHSLLTTLTLELRSRSGAPMVR